MYQVFQSLVFCHEQGIMHRDIKPSNIIINDKLFIKIIDWGLSEYYISTKEYYTRVSSRPYKSPELLVNNKKYHFSLDVWSAGVMLAGFIFREDYFFLGRDN